MKTDEMDLIDPDASRWMTARDLMGKTEIDLLRDEVRRLETFLWRLAFGADWAKAAPTCRCGRVMWRAARPYANSGTTRIAFACPDAVPFDYENGHQWATTTSPEHYLETDGACCGGLLETLEVRG
jgi:hypothetical protein